MYEGEWASDLFNGQGTLTTIDGTTYKGGFVNGQKEGTCVEIDAQGNRFEGSYLEGRRHGPFTKTDKEGKVIQQGTYEKGRLKSN